MTTTHQEAMLPRGRAKPSGRLAAAWVQEPAGELPWVVPLLSEAQSAATWDTLWSRSGQEPAAAIRADLLTAWTQPHRHCHGMRHLRECLSLWSEWIDHCARPVEVGLALWFSGAVCNPRSTDNASRSAVWAVRALAATTTSFERTQRIHDLVLATGGNAAARQRDADLVADIGLAFLGSSPQRFGAREQELRRERPWLAKAAYRLQRAAVMQDLLARPRIFRSEIGWSLLERQARANIATAFERLAA